MQAVNTVRSPHYPRLFYAIFFLLFALPFLSSCGSQKTIVNGLDEREANEILVFLSSRNIAAMKVVTPTGGGGGTKIVTYDIVVSEDKANEAMALLNQAGLPRRRSQNLLGIFSNVGLVPSEMEQQIRYQAGLAEQIASTIRKIDGVLDAEVQISFPKQDPLNRESKKGIITAAVYVKHNGVLDDPNAHLATKIKRLVSASVTGLDFDNVTVIPDLARQSEIPIFSGSFETEKQYVNVWSLIIAKESLTRFRIVFFTFLVLTLVLLLSLLWLGWKIYPILRDHGGIRELFHLQPLQVEKKQEAPPEEVKEAQEASKEEEVEQVDRDIDENP